MATGHLLEPMALEVHVQSVQKIVKSVGLKRCAPCAPTIPICMRGNAKPDVPMAGSTWEKRFPIENVYHASLVAVNVPMRPFAVSARMVYSFQPVDSVNRPVLKASSIYLGLMVLEAFANSVPRTVPSVNGGIDAWNASPPNILLTTTGAQRDVQRATSKMGKEKWGGCVLSAPRIAIPVKTA